jgi:hypothetical protein
MSQGPLDIALSILLLASAASLGACGDGAGSGDDGAADDGGSSDDGASSGDDAEGDGGEDGEDGQDGEDADDDGQTPACKRWVDCVAAELPAMLADAQAAYGPSGTCWSGDDESRAACDEGCRSSLDAAHADHPEWERCVPCEIDDHCGPGRVCQGGRCVECRDDADCASGSCAGGSCETGDSCVTDLESILHAVLSCPASCSIGGSGYTPGVCTETELCCLAEAPSEGVGGCPLSEPCEAMMTETLDAFVNECCDGPGEGGDDE